MYKIIFVNLEKWPAKKCFYIQDSLRNPDRVKFNLVMYKVKKPQCFQGTTTFIRVAWFPWSVSCPLKKHEEPIRYNALFVSLHGTYRLVGTFLTNATVLPIDINCHKTGKGKRQYKQGRVEHEIKGLQFEDCRLLIKQVQ